MKLFWLRRLQALAMIVEGSTRFFGVPLKVNLPTARLIARENGRRMRRNSGL